MPAPARIELIGLQGIPRVAPGDDLAALILHALRESNQTLHEGDMVVVAQKIVSKAEGRRVDLRQITPTPRAHELALRSGKDPRLVELILGQSREVLRALPGSVIVVHHRGWIMANAGIDQSNLEGNSGDDFALLLPDDPDASAAALRDAIAQRTGRRVGVIVNDSFGRPWRQGVVGTALGVAGWPALIDRRGAPDLYGRPLTRTIIGHADEIAAAASLVQGQSDEGRPVVVVRGVQAGPGEGCGQDLIRPAGQDLFR
ncbi:MAG: coenzyme F420-0:L-glutamate ligase [Nevskia sp.]|nr:coenzyme F420-0:L-glutamate ligase [Nevskia sp.]